MWFQSGMGKIFKEAVTNVGHSLFPVSYVSLLYRSLTWKLVLVEEWSLDVAAWKWQALYQTKAESNAALGNMRAVIFLAVGNCVDTCHLGIPQ